MALTVELLKKLDEEQEPLSKRLKLAQAAFKSSELHSQRKEEVILNWLCENGRNEVDIWTAFDACVKSSHMKKLSDANIRPAAKTSISKTLSQVLVEDTPDGTKLILLNCAVSLIENGSFQQHFKRQLDLYFELIASIIEAALKSNRIDYCIKILQNVSLLNKQAFNKEDFAVLFISKLPDIIHILRYFEENSNDDLTRIKAELFKCVQQVVFPKSRSKNIGATLKSLFDGNEDNQNNILGLVFEQLSSTACNEKLSHHMFPIIFHAFVSSYKNDPLSVYRMFVSMCYFIGFKPEVKISSDDEHKCLLKHKRFKKTFPGLNIKHSSAISATSLKVVRFLVQFLTQTHVELNANNENFQFLQWLEALMSTVFSIRSSTEDEEFLIRLIEFLSAFIHLDPLIIETKLNEIIENVILLKKESSALKLSYVTLLHDILEMFIKLHRLQKFIAKLLTLGKLLKDKNMEESIEVTDVLTSEFCSEFRTAVGFLPKDQSIGIMRSLLYHLNEYCVTELENQQGNPVLFLQITSELLCHFLQGCRLAEHSVPVHVVSKFCRTMIELQDLLGRLGQKILLREHSCALMREFLKLSYNWGEMRILLLHYGVKVESATFELELSGLQEDTSATNLSYLHPYLNNELWNLVAVRISNFAEADIKELLEKLVLQKLRVVMLFVEEGKLKQDVTTAIARHVASHVKDSKSLLLTKTNSSLITPFLSPDQLENIASHYVHETELTADIFIAVQESRELTCAFTCEALSGIMKLFSRTKLKHDSPKHKINPPSLIKDVLSKIDSKIVLKSLLENDSESLSSVIAEMAALVNEAFKENTAMPFTNGHMLNVTALLRYLQLLKSLPLIYTSDSLKTLVLVSILALAITLEKLNVWKEENGSELRNLLYQSLFLGIMDSPNPPNLSSHLNLELLIHWLTRVVTCLSRDLQSLLFQHIFESSIKDSSSLQQLQTELSVLQKHADTEVQEIEGLEAAVSLLHVLNKSSEKQKNPEDRSLFNKCQRRLSKNIVKMLQHVDYTTASATVSDAFSLVMLHYLKKGDQKHLEKLTADLSKVVDSVLSQLQDTDVSSNLHAYLNMVERVLQHRQQLNGFLPEQFIQRVWSVFISQRLLADLCSIDHWKLLFETATEKEFHVILKGIFTLTKTAFKSPTNNDSIKVATSIWKAVIVSHLDNINITSRKVALDQLCEMLLAFLGELSSSEVPVDATLVPVLELLIALAKTSLIFFSPEMLDLCLISVNTALLREPLDAFTLFSTLLLLLQTLITYRLVLLLDCIPSLLLSYRNIAAAVASHGHVDLKYPPDKLQQCAGCALQLERITKSLMANRHHFTRLAPYVIADLLRNFETYTLYPQVKLHYSNCVNILFNLCDHHALSFLSRTLSPASQQLLKTFHASYKKYYKFTGKV